MRLSAIKTIKAIKAIKEQINKDFAFMINIQCFESIYCLQECHLLGLAIDNS